MRRTTIASILLVAVFAATSVQGKSPVPPSEVASIELITAELESQLEKLNSLLTDPKMFDDNQEKIVQAGAVIACVSQAAIEHADGKETTYAAPALRDAGIELQEVGDHEEAKALLLTAQAAWKGKSTGEHADEHPWDELAAMYPLMEEMNDRNGGLSRSLRKPRGRISEQLNASTNAILALATLADHNYLEDENQTKQWDGLSKDYLQAMIHLTKAIADKDRDEVAIHYQAGNRACDKCHEVFRDN